jgi:hypothetical protein
LKPRHDSKRRPASPASPAPSKEALERRIAEALRAKGLIRGDLDRVDALRAASDRYKKAGKDELEAKAGALIEAIKAAPIDAELLNQRSAQFARDLERAASKVSKEDLLPLERRYMDARSRARDAQEDRERRTVLLELNELSRALHALAP